MKLPEPAAIPESPVIPAPLHKEIGDEVQETIQSLDKEIRTLDELLEGLGKDKHEEDAQADEEPPLSAQEEQIIQEELAGVDNILDDLNKSLNEINEIPSVPEFPDIPEFKEPSALDLHIALSSSITSAILLLSASFAHEFL